MARLKNTIPGIAKPILALAIGFAAWGAPQPAEAADIPVESEADYQTFLDAIRATEYTRQEYLESRRIPRAIVGIAGLWAYAEANPLATPDQLGAFIDAYDAELAQAVPGDELLLKTGSVLSAIVASRADSTGLLSGTDTRVAARVKELLELELPGLDGYQQSRLRMARYDLASVQRLINQTATADTLVSVLAGVDPAGNRVDGLASIAAGYLESFGFAPMLGAIDPDQTEVNAGLTGLPDYQGFLAIRDIEGAHLGLEDEVFIRIGEVEQNSAAILSDIGLVEVQPNLALDSLSLFAAANDPDDPDHAEAIAFFEARRQAIIDLIRESSDDRAAILARTLILQQSSFAEVQAAATISQNFSDLQIQTNNNLAVFLESYYLAGVLGEDFPFDIAEQAANGDLWGAAQSSLEFVADALGLTEQLGLTDAPPPVEEQIFIQIVELRQQVEDLRVQLNARFDIVDQKLDTIFETMIIGFGSIGDQVGDLQDDVDDLAANLAEARTTLDRIEAALFGFAEDALLLPLSLQADLVLDYRNDAGVDLFYRNETPSFVDGASFFYTYATTTSKSTVFAGPTSQQLTLANAQATLEGQPIARSLNDLRRIPVGLFTTDGVPVIGPITAARVPAPAPWSQSAAAYRQLAQESPWYFAFMLRSQLTERGGNGEIDDIIADGERITALAAATRNRADLFNGILQRALDITTDVGSFIETFIDGELFDLGFSDGVTIVDPWGPIDQVASPLVDPVDGFSLIGEPFLPLPDAASLPHRGFEVFIADSRTGGGSGLPAATLAERNALTLLTTSGTRQYVADAFRTFPSGPSVTVTLRMEISDPVVDDLVVERRIRTTLQYRNLSGQWVSWPSNMVPPFYRERLAEAWSDLAPELDNGDLTGDSFFSGFEAPAPGPSLPTRLLVTSDTTVYGADNQPDFQIQQDIIAAGLLAVRNSVRVALLDELTSAGTDLGLAGADLDNTSALLDAYLTLGFADAMNQSELLRSATRGIPSADGLGFRSDDILSLVLTAIQRDQGAIGGAPGIDVPTISAHLGERIVGLSSEIDKALGTDAPSFPYVEFVLAELRDLRENAFRLAIDDTYLAAGALSVDGAEGLMANDIGQPGRIDTQDLMVDAAFFALPEHIAPANGSLTVFDDGSFNYTPNPGFTGTDSFNYRLIARVDDSDTPVGDPDVRSEPATVVIVVNASNCPADVSGDGSVDLSDLNLVLANFGQLTDAGDSNGDGVVDLADLNAVLGAFGQACP